MIQHLLLATASFISIDAYNQTLAPDLQDSSKWQVINRTATVFTEINRKGISLNEVADDGLMILKGSNFSNGVIELDIKGSSKMQQSFVGIAFHSKDLKTYDGIYFRPFNFKSDDPIRRTHAVQYISLPGYDWEKLRTEFPGKYENKIDPAPGPDEWFHAKIAVNGKHVSVFVNNQQQACLEIDKLNSNTNGGIGLWLGNNSAGSFANLHIMPASVNQ